MAQQLRTCVAISAASCILSLALASPLEACNGACGPVPMPPRDASDVVPPNKKGGTTMLRSETTSLSRCASIVENELADPFCGGGASNWKPLDPCAGC